MMNQTKKLRSTAVDDVMFLGLLVIIPMMAVLITSFIFLALIKNGNDAAGLIQTWVVMGISFVAIPAFIVNKKYKITAGDIGVVKIEPLEMVAGLFLLILLYCYLTGKTDRYSLLLLALQTLAVAVCEEIWARGILFFVIGKFMPNRIAVIILSSILFTFFIHINRGFYNNLIYRLPGAIIMSLVYDRSRKIHYSVMVHFAYNMLTSV